MAELKHSGILQEGPIGPKHDLKFRRSHRGYPITRAAAHAGAGYLIAHSITGATSWREAVVAACLAVIGATSASR